ncbi:ABC transporter [Brachybacterium sp. SGAir0954]|nr:ABC transporter [Brachybacterium sp. SGAir0954]
MRGDTRAAEQITGALESRGMLVENLSPVGVRPGIGEYLAQLWERRHFIWMDARHRVATQNSRNRLGSLWLVLKPMLDAVMYFVVFVLILGVTRNMENYAAYVIIGVMMFRSTMRSIGQGANTLQSGKAMIRAFSFPRASLAISAEIRDALQMTYAVATMLVMIVIIPPHVFPAVTWLLVPVVFLMQFFLNLGITFCMARIGQLFPDTTQLMTFAGRFLMYGSGVLFPVERFLTHPIAMALITANPIYHMLALYRGLLMDHVIPPAEHWAILGGWACGLTVIGFLFFWQGEESYGSGQ